MSSYGGGFGRGSSRRSAPRGRQVFGGSSSSGRGGGGRGAPPRNGRAGRSSSASKSAGHWFDGRWYPASAGRSGSASSRGRDQSSWLWERDYQPRDYLPGEGDFDAGEGDEGFARRIGFRF